MLYLWILVHLIYTFLVSYGSQGRKDTLTELFDLNILNTKYNPREHKHKPVNMVITHLHLRKAESMIPLCCYCSCCNGNTS